MNRYNILFFIGLILAGCVGTGLNSSQFYSLKDQNISSMQKKALQGDGQAAYALSLFYDVSKQDFLTASYWRKLSAIDGYPTGMYAYGLSLSYKKDLENRNEAHYWLKKATESNDENIIPLATFELSQMDKRDKEATKSQ